MKSVFFTVVYPGIEPFLFDFFQSLKNQTTEDFSLILVNDGVDNIDSFFQGFNSSRITVLESGKSPAENRIIGIQHALHLNAKYLIFGDSDDFFSKNRVASSIQILEEGADVVVNNLSAVDVNGDLLDSNYLSRRIDDKSKITIDFIQDKNLLGLSNTAVRTSLLKNLNVPKHLIAVDWYLFSVLLLHKSKAIFNAEANTYYRQHGANTVGVGCLDELNILKQLKIKTQHYEAMNQLSDQYNDLFLYKKTLQKLKNEPQLISNYVDFLKKKAVKNPLWWENILPWENVI